MVDLKINTSIKNAKGYSKDTPGFKTPSFSGHKLFVDDKGEKVYKFYLPAEDKQNVVLEVVKLEKDTQGNLIQDKSNVLFLDSINREKTLSLNDLGILPDEEKGLVLGYRFFVNDKPYLDNSYKVRIGNDNYNIARSVDRAILEQPMTMYHLLPDIFNVAKPEGKEYQRNHFVKLGGKLDGVIDKIPYLKSLGVKKILSTPIFGQDQISNHGYWTTNPYQMTSSLGDINKFKELQIKLFKNGMGWVADGAFVNEGLEGIHAMDLRKRSKDSVFADWFETYDLKDEPIRHGVLPKTTKLGERLNNGDDNWQILILNSPYEYDEKGNLTSNKRKNDAKKPIKIQLYDKRLVTDAQVKAALGKGIPIDKYAKLNADNPNEISNYMDAIQPYNFEISRKELDANIEKWKKAGAKHEDLKNYLSRWANFELVSSDKDGGVESWVGNKDIIKLRFIPSPSKLEDRGIQVGTPRYEDIMTAKAQVQDYVVNVGAYWTKVTSDILLNHIISSIKGDKTFSERINSAISKKELPETAAISDVEINRAIAKPGAFNNFLVENSLQPIMDFPIEAIEFSPELTSLLVSPYLKGYASSDAEIGSSRYERSKKDILGEKIPAKYRKTLLKVDDFYLNKVQSLITNILKEMNENLVSEDGTLTNKGREIYNLISSDLAKYIHVKMLNSDLEPSVDKDGNIVYDESKLRQITPQSLGIPVSSPEIEAQQLLNIFKNNIDKVKKDEIAKILKSKIQNVTVDDVRVAKAILLKTEGGLNWRIDAAKDILDLDSVLSERSTYSFGEAWEEAIKFWKNFNDSVRKYNAKSYTIGEVTDVPELIIKGKDAGRFKDAGDAEHKFIEETGFTTQTNYSYLYSSMHGLFGRDTEKDAAPRTVDIKDLMEKLFTGWAGTSGFLFSGPADNIQYSHVGMGNQDKPRALHSFALDMNLFYSTPYSSECPKELIDKYYDNPIAEKVEPSAIAMGEVLNYAFKSEFSEDEKTKKAITQAIKNLVNGKFKNENFNVEYFAVRPFDININYVFEEAKYLLQKSEIPNESEVFDRALAHILDPAKKKLLAAYSVMLALPGNMTNYAGDELGETGFETKCKNEYVQNRNRIHWERKDKSYVDDLNNNVAKIFGLKTAKHLSPLVNGETVALHNDDKGVFTIMRYNDKSDVIAVLNKSGFGPDRVSAGQKMRLDKIFLSEGDVVDNYFDKNGPHRFGLPFKLEKDKMYKVAYGGDFGETYKVVTKEDKQYLINVKDEDTFFRNWETPNGINVEPGALILYRITNYDGTPNNPAFNGNMKVAIANMSYRIPANQQQKKEKTSISQTLASV